MISSVLAEAVISTPSTPIPSVQALAASTGFPWLAVYPLEPEALVTLTITPAPERMRRVLLLVRPLEHPLSLPAPPTPEPLSREGYTAFEWGVVLDL